MPGFDQPGPGPDPDLTETAVLPHFEGPPLVRPYAPSAPLGDPFATTVLPPQQPPVVPQQPTAGQLPPVPPRPSMPPHAPSVPVAPPAETTALLPPAPPSAAPRELGLFPLATAEPAGSRGADRRARGRRTGLIATAGAGAVVLGVGLAFALAPGSGDNHQALPVLPTGVQEPSPSAQPSSTAAPSATAPASTAAPSPARPTVAPRSKAASPTAAPTTAAPPTTQAPKPSPSSSPTPSQSPSPTAAQVLQPGMSGPAVSDLQQRLAAAGCGNARSGTYDGKTRSEVSLFQNWNGIWPTQGYGIYDAQTRTALEGGKTC
ncbi:hypothetical protein C7C46_19350 [Streptomyces tateyamensis]|uniref:Peptidoglycan binding-like domain-containing protein n=1 Tax=Streptomyces tateyamensis TaxID=565073 RepID=A0A2V4NMY4_9ACTN|nr:peptidoglycan-binding domain-containing protein [Streptomyces tateyamensis]PYC77298.1 hypothetical protein C7C46_19350 [Streptomyces tateyamensis]